MIRNHFYIVILLFLGLKVSAQSGDFKVQLDSIQGLRWLSGNPNFDIETRIRYAKKARALSYKTAIDSVILRSEINLSDCYLYDEQYYKDLRELNYSNLKRARKLKDLKSESSIYQSLANSYHRSINQDSSYYYYYKALDILEYIGDSRSILLERAQILLNIGYLQNDERDYIGSQSTTMQGINLLHQFTDPESLDMLCYLYNSLSLNLVDLKEYDNAFEYYKKALNISTKLSNHVVELYIKINLAELFRETENYDRVFKIYNKLLEDTTIKEKDPISYGAILNNLAYTMFLAKKENYKAIDSLFTRANKTFEYLNLSYELSASGNDMAEYYYATQQKARALYYAKRSYKKAKEIREHGETLRALKMLSKLKEGNKGKAYLFEYIRLNDSLIDNERINRNKYARIQFETDQYIKETQRLSTQNVLISTIGGILLLILGLLYYIKTQRSKNKALVFASEQEKANQEIYKLMLQQQSKQEEGRLQERHRIAEELHDGVLSRLFGTRMGMGFLEVRGDDQTMKQYKVYIEELQTIEKEVREVSHALKKETALSRTNFEALIEQYLESQSVIANFKYRIKKDSTVNFETLNEGVRVEIYRIIQEAVQNIVKHAQAQNVSITFSVLKKPVLVIKIKDNGIGFDAQKNYKGIGLKNIASRVSKLEGHFKITSTPDKGTELYIKIPNLKSV
ncbi:ATP-binding protein [Tamlana sp. 2201CG12-4]|uniref:tetratricopeptide repeat-containing sensor histidine kinase n=1 Tax=Tamlana sp. 2201CG12-4 TaxID=3112582 RepID=UPI002DB71827|nr:ATP-binding protein [Tamlana sp. 2201CG12-4]MEC3906218.1 ATP-binding protein [Tamlana sp. 2201CG12-4]